MSDLRLIDAMSIAVCGFRDDTERRVADMVVAALREWRVIQNEAAGRDWAKSELEQSGVFERVEIGPRGGVVGFGKVENESIPTIVISDAEIQRKGPERSAREAIGVFIDAEAARKGKDDG